MGVESFEKRELAVILLQLNLVYDFGREIVGNLLVLISEEILTVNENLLHRLTIDRHLSFLVHVHPR